MRASVRISLVFVFLGIIWIIFSDSLVVSIFADAPALLNLAQSTKGIAFVLMVGVLLFALIEHELRRYRLINDALTRREGDLLSLFQNNPLAMWIFDPVTLEFLEVNQAAVQQYGYTVAEFRAMRVTDIHPAEGLLHIIKSLQANVETQSDYRLLRAGVWRHQRKDRSVLFVELLSREFVYNQRQSLLAVVYEVTARYQLQQELVRTTRTLQSIVNASPFAIMLLDVEGRVRLWNPASEQTFGWQADAVQDQPLPVIPPERQDEFNQWLLEVRQGEIISDAETCWQRQDGTKIDVLVALTRLQLTEWGAADDSAAATTEILMLARDITSRKELELERLEKEKLKEALEQEIQLRAVRNRLISMMSHDFRTPLTSIKLSGEMLERYLDRMPQADRQRRLDSIQEQTGRALEMLDDLLAKLRNEVTTMDFDPQLHDLNRLINESVSHVVEGVTGNHQIVVSPAEDLPVVEVDARLVHHAVENLLTNAVKYTPMGGSIHVAVKSEVEADRVRIQVKDPGIGIPQADLARLFDPFYRASNVGSIAGSGIGLSIVRQAVELHGGSIEVESEEGKGTTITFWLPVRQAS